MKKSNFFFPRIIPLFCITFKIINSINNIITNFVKHALMNKITQGGTPPTPSRRKKFRNILAFWESKIDTVDIPEGADIEITDSTPVMTGGGGSGTILGYNFFD